MKDYWHNTCPNCGKQKYLTSKLCASCRYANTASVSRRRKDPCPECGRPKLLDSRRCHACHTGHDLDLAEYRGRNKADLASPRWDLVTREFLLQFAGVFMSEGCVTARLSRGKTLAVSLAIKLRGDDAECLRTIQCVLGGGLRFDNRAGHSPEVAWYVSKRDDVRAILTAVRPLILIPMKKAREFDVALEYFDWRDSVGFHHVDREKTEQFAKRIAALKKLQIS